MLILAITFLSFYTPSSISLYTTPRVAGPDRATCRTLLRLGSRNGSDPLICFLGPLRSIPTPAAFLFRIESVNGAGAGQNGIGRHLLPLGDCVSDRTVWQEKQRPRFSATGTHQLNLGAQIIHKQASFLANNKW